ncbi:MAG: Ig-like domain-containing protein [Methanobacteriaceae archaeon]|nr:Ig-like domain-containing protein [Methanobacteriaceae archaeon]
MGVVSAASLTVDEVAYGSNAVKDHTASHGKIPGYVKINGKNSTTPSFLNTLTKTVVQVNQDVETPVTISSVGAAPSPSGSATGTISKSEYITVASNVKSFISSNGRAPNYAVSSKGNIRYESLVYTYARIMDYYRINGQLPSSLNIVNIVGTTGGVNIQDTTRPTVTNVDPANNKIINVANKALVITFSENIKAGSAFTNIKVTNPDGVSVNPLYKVINGKTLTLTRNGYYINGLTYTITLPTGSITDTAGNALSTFTSKFTVDFVKPTVTSVDPANNKIINVANKALVITFSEAIKAGSAFTSIKVTNADGVSVDPLYKVINGKTLNLTRNGYYINGLTYTITLPTGSITDTAGNTLATAFTSKFTIDTTKPTVTANLATGVYNTTKSVTLTATDNVDSNPAIYYTTNGGTPTISSTRYTTPITISTTTTLKFIGRDSAGNVAAVQTRTYTIDKIAPTISSSDPVAGAFNVSGDKVIKVTFSEPVKAGTLFIELVNDAGVNVPISSSISGKVLTVTPSSFLNAGRYSFILHTGSVTDLTNNPLALTGFSFYTFSDTLAKVKVDDRFYYSIQSAIDSYQTTAGDIVYVNSGVYTENVLINKKITLAPSSDDDVVITPFDNSKPAFKIISTGSGSVISGFTINGSVLLNSTGNCTVLGNIFTDSGGVHLINSGNNIISSNSFTGNNGVVLEDSSGNSISANSISVVGSNGVLIRNSMDNIIRGNDISSDGESGIIVDNSSVEIHFNRIAGNYNYGMEVLNNSIVNATNNWWGTNNVICINSTAPPSSCNIWNKNSYVIYDPWLVLSVKTNNVNSGGRASVTADLTHNNQEQDTSSDGHIPNGIPVNFTTNFGTIIGSACTVKGKADTILNLGSIQNVTAAVSAHLDSETVSSQTVITTGMAVIKVQSTAIDYSTGQNVNLTYTLPLNASVTWVSVLWKATGLFKGELDLIVDGNVVQSVNYFNSYYDMVRDDYRQNVFLAILDCHRWGDISVSQNTLNTMAYRYGLTDDELQYIEYYGPAFIDELSVNIEYPGVDAPSYIPLPEDYEYPYIYFTGKSINRHSAMMYVNSHEPFYIDGNGGLFQDEDAFYDGIRSFAIATTRVTDDIVEYWADQINATDVNGNLLYPKGPMKAAYGTFFASLMMIYMHDLVADEAANELNVTWGRTSPIIVSVCDDPHYTYITLECDHSMGMTVVGSINNMWNFRYVTTSIISIIETMVMNNITLPSYDGERSFNSVQEYILNAFENGSEIEIMFTLDGYVMIKLEDQNDIFLILDPETGIMRDVVIFEVYRNENYNGAYCFHDTLTEKIHDFGNFIMDGLAIIPGTVNTILHGEGYGSLEDHVVVNAESITETKNMHSYKINVTRANIPENYGQGPRAREYQGRVYMVPGKYPNYRYIISHITAVTLGPLSLYSGVGFLLGRAGVALGLGLWVGDVAGFDIFDWEGMNQPAYWDDINQTYDPWYGYQL